jgi:hypothetical protein
MQVVGGIELLQLVDVGMIHGDSGFKR